MRHVARYAAELGQIPGAAGGAEVLGDADHGQRQQGAHGHLQTLACVEVAQKTFRPPHAQCQKHDQCPPKAAGPFVQDMHKEPLVPQGEAVG